MRASSSVRAISRLLSLTATDLNDRVNHYGFVVLKGIAGF